MSGGLPLVDRVLYEVETSTRPRSVYEIAASLGEKPDAVRAASRELVSIGAAAWTPGGDLAVEDGRSR